MSQALYRRYRPDTFADLVGQDHVSDTLMAALDSGRASHAYLFSGPRGCGKTTSARIMARCLNCKEGPTSAPCGVCESCVELASGGPGSLDVIEMDAASNRGIDDARDLRERAEFAPVRDRYKVVILDEAHMVTKEGANALLKLIEEPPPHVKFIFATTEPERMLPTIRSRTHHYQFRLVPPQVLSPYLESICEKEGVKPEPGVLDLVVRAGAGSVRDSLSVLDQLLAGTRDGVLPYSSSAALLGYTDSALLDEVVGALGENDGARVFEAIEKVVGAGVDPRRFAEDLLQRLRDLVICALAPQQADAILSHLAVDQLERMKVQANAWGSRVLSRRADVVEEGLTKMVGAAAPRLMLELLMGRLLVAGQPEGMPAVQLAQNVAASAPKTIPQRDPVSRPVEEAPFRQASASNQGAPPWDEPKSTFDSQGAQSRASKSPASQPPVPSRMAAASDESGTPRPGETGRPPAAPTQSGAVNLQASWPKIVDEGAKLSAVLGALLRSAKPVADGNAIHLNLSGPLAGRVKSNQNQIEQAIKAVLGDGWSLADGGFGPSPKAEAATAPPAPEAEGKRAPERQSVPPTPVSTPVATQVAEPAQEPVSTQVAAPSEQLSAASTTAPAFIPEPQPMSEPVVVEAPVSPPREEKPDASVDTEPDFDDMPSMDDENVETNSSAGVDLVLEVLGGRVLEED